MSWLAEKWPPGPEDLHIALRILRHRERAAEAGLVQGPQARCLQQDAGSAATGCHTG